MAKFIKKNIIYRYGVPYELISDHGSHFQGEVLKLLEKFKITHHMSAPYRPQTNGAVEAANKNIKTILRKMADTYRDWSEKLPLALWGYRTSMRMSTGATPFSLVYGTEAVLPVEVELASLQVMSKSQVSEVDWLRSQYDQLGLLDEKRLAALDHVQGYQRRVARAFNKRVRPRNIEEGDLVLKELRGNVLARDHLLQCSLVVPSC